MADIKGLCHICGKVADHTCKLCGKACCSEHYIAASGSCTAHGMKRQPPARKF